MCIFYDDIFPKMVSLATAHVQKMIKQLSQNIAADFVTPRLTGTIEDPCSSVGC
jgi:hypothetical protein